MLSIFIYHCTRFFDTEGWRRWWQGLLARRCGCWMAGQFVLRSWGHGLAVGARGSSAPPNIRLNLTFVATLLKQVNRVVSLL